MKPSIEDVLAFEIKKELADRYFGFRKLIEEDKNVLDQRLRHYSFTLEQRICQNLVRIYILLKEEKLIYEFLELVGLEEAMFYDHYLTESPTIRQRVFKGVKQRGMTRAGRFKNLLIDTYEELVDDVESYREKLGQLVEERELINEEIKLFYKKNDIGNIMGFLRNMDGRAGSGGIEGAIEVGMADAMEKKMRIAPLQSIEQVLPIIPPLVPYSDIRKQLKQLVDKAYEIHGRSFRIDEYHS
jgi:hypothetical protein